MSDHNKFQSIEGFVQTFVSPTCQHNHK